MTLKEQMSEDLERVFFSTDEFADDMEVVYGKHECTIPVLIDSAGEGARNRYKDDNEASTYDVDIVARMRKADIVRVPRKGRPIFLDKEKFDIATVEHNGGEIILGLKRYDE